MTTYVVLDFTTLMIYGVAAEKISIWLKSKPKTLNTISACVLVIIAYLYCCDTELLIILTVVILGFSCLNNSIN